jgi:hypothetical protein
MAWSETTSANGYKVYTETITLPASATAGYSSQIDFLEADPSTTTNNVIVVANASAVSGTNLDLSLIGHWTKDTAGASMVTLVDAYIADITATGNNIDVLDVNAYPMPYYRLKHISDADESANTITYTVIVKKEQPLNIGLAAGDMDSGVGADPS